MKFTAPPLATPFGDGTFSSQWQRWLSEIGDALRGDNSRRTISAAGGSFVFRSVGGVLHISASFQAGVTCTSDQINLPCSVEPGILLLTDGTALVSCVAVSGSTLSLPGHTFASNGAVSGTLAQKES